MKKDPSKDFLKRIWNVVGVFAFAFAVFGWYGTTGQSAELPILGELAQIEIVIFGIPILFFTTLILCLSLRSYRKLRDDDISSPPLPDSDAIPSNGPELRWVRTGLMVAYLLIPAAAQTHFLIKTHKATLVNIHTQNEFDGAEIYLAHDKPFDTRYWRWRDWHDKEKKISAIPRFQPIAYNLFVGLSWFLVFWSLYVVIKDHRAYSRAEHIEPEPEIGFKDLGHTLNEILDELKRIGTDISNTRAEQGGADQPATAPEPEPEDNEEPLHESEVRPQ